MYLNADALHIPLKDNSVHMVVTSPPYWGLRSYDGTVTWEGGDPSCDHEPARIKTRFDYVLSDKQQSNKGSDLAVYKDECPCGAYKVDKQLGQEKLHDCLAWARGEEPCQECFICNVRRWAKEIWRVLRDDGTFWLNIGDSYSGSGGPGSQFDNMASKKLAKFNNPNRKISIRPKSLIGIPWRTALALQADGWIVRSEIIWYKPNPMVEPHKDRPTKSHEPVYLLMKSPKYYYDNVAIAEPTVDGKAGKTRNARSVWTITPQRNSFNHFAAYPEEFAERCVLAGTSEKGVCPECGAQWERITKKEFVPQEDVRNPVALTRDNGKGLYKDDRRAEMKRGSTITKTIGWRPSCNHNTVPIPAIVLDPFNGSGTTKAVCDRIGRDCIGLDISFEYIQGIAKKRTAPKPQLKMF